MPADDLTIGAGPREHYGGGRRRALVGVSASTNFVQTLAPRAGGALG